MKTKYFTVAILAILALSSCATESDVFDVEELNISQTGQTVEILNVTSVRIKSTSKEGVAVATAGGAAAGGIVGKKKSKDNNKTADTAWGYRRRRTRLRQWKISRFGNHRGRNHFF